jgi:cytochrome oxidase assembly protein ShyY1
MMKRRESSVALVKSGTFWVGTLLALVATTAFAALGVWQWNRGEWKSRYLDAYAVALTAEPLPLAEAMPRSIRDSLAEVPIPVRAAGEGSFDAAFSVLLDNQRRGNDVGVLVFSLFRPADGTPALLVNRGWLPLDDSRGVAVSIEPPVGRVRIGGLLRRPPSSGVRLGSAPALDGPDGPPLLPWLDIAELGAAWGLELPPVVLELDPSSPAGFRRDADPLPNTLPPEQHRGYAVQWWGLAIAVATIWLVLVLRARGDDGQSTTPR